MRSILSTARTALGSARSSALFYGVLIGAALLSCAGPESRFPQKAAQGPCDDFELDVERFWSHSSKTGVRAGILSVTGEYTESLTERVVTKMDSITRDWVMMQQCACKDTVVRKIVPPEVYVKVAACMRVALTSQRTVVEAMKSPSKAQVFRLDEVVLAIGRDNAECQKEAVYSAYAPRESDRLAVIAAREGSARTSAIGTGTLGSSDLDIAQQAQGEARGYEKISDRAKWAEALERGIAAARRAKEPKVLVGLLLSDANRLRSLESKFAPALERIREAQVIAERAGFEEGLGWSFDMTGVLFNDQGKYPEALEWLQKALVIKEKIFGKDDPHTAATYHNIATVYHGQGKYAEALQWYQRGLVILEKVLGKEHPDTAMVYNSVAIVYADQGKFTEALQWYQKALVIREKVLGKDHPDTAKSYNNIATVYAMQARYSEALEFFQKALAVDEKILGKEHPSTAGTYNNIALTYSKQGKYSDALQWYQKAIAIYEKVLGKNHPETATAYNNVANVYSSQGKYPESLEWHMKALVIRERVLGTTHPDTASTYNNIAIVYHSQGKYQEALQWYQKALVIQEKVLGKAHPSTMATYSNVDTLCTKERFEPACSFLTQHPRS